MLSKIKISDQLKGAMIMKLKKLCTTICLSGFFFIAMNANGTPKQKTQQFIPTNPTTVLLIKQNLQNKKYKKIGTIKVASYNFVGVKKQEADINDLLQVHAANLGGDAIIDIHSTPKAVYGTVVKLMG